VQPLARPDAARPLPTRPVPAPSTRPAFLTHPRLRRASPITQYAAGAALEALGKLAANSEPVRRLGLVVCLQSGCVQYSSRFFEETLRDPLTASPLVFPETVFAAPASHIATLLEHVTLTSTLVGDPACFLQGLALAADWLQGQPVDACVVVGAEENHWLRGDALWHFQHSSVMSSGAGALCLGRNPAWSLGVELSVITNAHTYSARLTRERAAQAMRAQLPPGTPQELLCDSQDDSSRIDAAERAAWRDWPGRRMSVKPVLGEGLMAASAWQCVTACDTVSRGDAPAATVSVVGCNQQAIGARFVKTRPEQAHV
jgi:3-oxoacyl-(acyl-carrier-protein) synthase